MIQFVKGLWMRLWFRCCALLAVALLSILIFAYLYIDSTGVHRWAAVQQMLAREGESLDFRAIAPEPVPDELNFCAIPALKDLAIIPADNDDKSAQGQKRLRLINAWPPPGNKSAARPKLSLGPSLGTAIDLKAWADALRQDGSPPDSGDPARDVLAELSNSDALVSELALGLNRPESQWTPAWKTRDLPKCLFAVAIPHYTVAQGLVSMLGLRSAAAVRAGDAAKAHESLLIAVRINEANMNEPFLIGTLVACGTSVLTSGAVWELCNAHTGTAEDFRRLQEALSQLDFRKSNLFAERGELAGAASAGEYLRITRDMSFLDMPPPSNAKSGYSLTMHLIPGGFFDANTAAITQWHFDYYLKPLRDAGFKEVLAKQKELEALMEEHASHRFEHLDEILAMIAMPAFSSVSRKLVYAQSLTNQSIAACALERYRIEHNNTYPDTLEEANHPGEKSIPADVISGKPMGYRKTPDGKYALWCFGLEGKDHGGHRALDEKAPTLTKFASATYSGDWVWSFQPGE
jgi:hypothetical protein